MGKNEGCDFVFVWNGGFVGGVGVLWGYLCLGGDDGCSSFKD